MISCILNVHSPSSLGERLAKGKDDFVKFLVIRSVSEFFSSGSYETGTIFIFDTSSFQQELWLVNQELSFVKYQKNLIT